MGHNQPTEWLASHDIEPESDRGEVVLTVMESQRYRLAMYASCAFYWDDLTRLEAGYGVRSALHAASLLDGASAPTSVVGSSASWHM